MFKKIIKIIVNNKIKVLSFIIILLIIFIGTLVSFSYFTDSGRTGVFQAVIKYFENPDVAIRVLVENVDETGAGTGEYTVVRTIPKQGYVFDEGLSECSNGASFEKEENGFIIHTTTRSKCNFYYNVESTVAPPNIGVLLFKKGLGESSYSSASYYTYKGLDKKGFSFTSLTCTNGATATYNESTWKLNVSTTSNTVCKVYFDQDDLQ